MKMRGTIISIDFPKQGKKPWKFTFEKQDETTIQVATYDDNFNNELVGAEVEIDAQKNKYGWFSKEVEVVKTVEGEAPQTSEQAGTKKKPGRPSNKKPAQGSGYKKPTLVKNAPKSSREDYRQEAEEATRKNLQSAIKLADEFGVDWKSDVRALVALTDLASRTQTSIFMDAQKDKRMKNFS